MEEDIRDIVRRLAGNSVINPDDLLDVLLQMAQRIAARQARIDQLESPRTADDEWAMGDGADHCNDWGDEYPEDWTDEDIVEAEELKDLS